MNNATNLGSRIREERERLGLSQTQMGESGGVNRVTQGAYERGERACTTAYLEGVETAGADVAYIVTGNRYARTATEPAVPAMVMMQVAMPPRQALAQMFEAVLQVYPDLRGAELAQALARHLPSGLAQLVDLIPATPAPFVPAAADPQGRREDHPAPRSAQRT